MTRTWVKLAIASAVSVTAILTAAAPAFAGAPHFAGGPAVAVSGGTLSVTQNVPALTASGAALPLIYGD